MAKKTAIDTVKHKDKRANIPTEELRDFLSDEEKEPKSLLYPRDTALDPQLIWKEKDKQDSQDLEVPALPIYIQEKIHPQAIIEDFRTQAKKEQFEQLSLFGDFNGLAFEKLIDFYQHKEGVSWTNRMILGDSLLVMGSLAEKEGLKGKVQMIYLDPPYGIKFGSNWQVSTRKRDVKDGKAEEVTRQPEQVKAFRDTWELGIHSYLAYLRDRLVVARELLTETGSIFVQISDENVHLVRCLMDEVFGASNHVCQITYATSTGRTSKYISNVNDYLVWYAKNYDSLKFREILLEKQENQSIEPDSFELGDLTSQGASNQEQPFKFQDSVFKPSLGRHWSNDHITGMPRLAKADRIVRVSQTQIRAKKYLWERSTIPLHNRWLSRSAGKFISM